MESTNEITNNNEHQDLLTDESYELNPFVYATQGQRFLNWLIDNLLMRFALSYATGIAIGALLANIAPEFLNRIAYSEGRMSAEILLLSMLIGYLNYIIYYTLCEKLFKGYTLGKIITGSRAIRQDGDELSFKDALLRSLSRCVPFEVFSGFNTLTWHDSWTDTMVIKSR
ncbi:MAG: RDD family protein [Chitinophagaceae bacterium]|nr:RDD family protein [Chitinophagaceae bacterium]